MTSQPREKIPSIKCKKRDSFLKSGDHAIQYIMHEKCTACGVDISILKDCYAALDVMEYIIKHLTNTKDGMLTIQSTTPLV